MKKCDHILGYLRIDIEASYLVYDSEDKAQEEKYKFKNTTEKNQDNEDTYLFNKYEKVIRFKYCPKCGIRFGEKK